MNPKNYFFDLIKLFISFNIAYFYFIAPYFSYIGLIADFQFHYFLISVALIFFYSLIIKVNGEFLSDLFKISFVIISLIPSLTLFVFNALTFGFMINWFFIFLFFIIIFNSKINFQSINSFPFSISNSFIWLLLFFSSIVYFSYFRFNLNFEYFNILSSSLYEGREEYSQTLRSLGSIRYFFSNFQNVFLPIILAYGLIRKNYPIIIFTLLFFMYVFLNSTFKSILLSPVLILSTFVIYRLFNPYLPNFLLKHSYKFILLSCLIDYFLKFPFFNGIIIRRIFFFPVLIAEKYFEYFNENGFTYFSDLPFLEYFSVNPFLYSIPKTIGNYYFYESGYMNVGFLADAYTKAGLFSVILYVIILKILISFSDSNKNIQNQFISFSIIIVPLISLANSSLTTTLFSHGLLLALFVSSKIKSI
tara:strand:- start:6524 stop:7777 length:1254 start_codon:yes stop_codon:yes gene_type:complete